MGRRWSSGWQWQGAEEQPDERSGGKVVTIRLAHDRWPVEVAVHTLLDGTALLTRWLEITNTGATSRRRSRSASRWWAC